MTVTNCYQLNASHNEDDRDNVYMKYTIHLDDSSISLALSSRLLLPESEYLIVMASCNMVV